MWLVPYVGIKNGNIRKLSISDQMTDWKEVDNLEYSDWEDGCSISLEKGEIDLYWERDHSLVEEKHIFKKSEVTMLCPRRFEPDEKPWLHMGYSDEEETPYSEEFEEPDIIQPIVFELNGWDTFEKEFYSSK
jgi:hypothetical protein